MIQAQDKELGGSQLRLLLYYGGGDRSGLSKVEPWFMSVGHGGKHWLL